MSVDVDATRDIHLFRRMLRRQSRNHQFLDGQQAFGSTMSDDALSDVLANVIC